MIAARIVGVPVNDTQYTGVRSLEKALMQRLQLGWYLRLCEL